MLYALALVKSVWDATIHIVWGIATIFLLGGLLAYFEVDTSQITSLLKIAYWLMENWTLFWWSIFILVYYSEIKGILKEWKQQRLIWK